MGSRLSTLATCGFGVLTGGQPAKLPSFGGYSLETLPHLIVIDAVSSGSHSSEAPKRILQAGTRKLRQVESLYLA